MSKQSEIYANSKAVQILERGIKALQRKKYTEAREIFSSIEEKHGSEMDVVDRARSYIRACDRMTTAPRPAPTSVEENFLRAVYHVNRDELDEAQGILEELRKKQPKNDRVLYVLAALYARKGDEGKAIKTLTDAVRLDDACRYVAREDRDFSSLRNNPEFSSLVG